MLFHTGPGCRYASCESEILAVLRQNQQLTFVSGREPGISTISNTKAFEILCRLKTPIGLTICQGEDIAKADVVGGKHD